MNPGALAQANNETAPLALKMHEVGSTLLQFCAEAPKALFNASLGHRPRNSIVHGSDIALKARFNFSIPDIALVKIDAMPVQQLTIFFLKSASAMVLLLRVDVFQHRIELTWAHRKRGIALLPEKAAIVSVNSFHPLGRCLLYLLDELSLRKSSRQRRHNVNMVRNTAYVYEVAVEIATNCCQISMHARTHAWIEPSLAILRAKADVKDDFTERLGHAANHVLNSPIK